jgi:Sjogren's syndrome/scleroderma autoantigen 1 (Autoantigen p27)
MLRSPPPDPHLLCVKCGRDTSLPNGTPASPINGSESNVPPAGYHPFANGDDMDSDEEEHEAGVMQVDPTARAIATLQSDRIHSNYDVDQVARREQSDRASKLIGERLLQGYCLLDEICPTETCFGVCILSQS